MAMYPSCFIVSILPVRSPGLLHALSSYPLDDLRRALVRSNLVMMQMQEAK